MPGADNNIICTRRQGTTDLVERLSIDEYLLTTAHAVAGGDMVGWGQ